jgi:glyoxylase-like metal-dependent hydrolase (beta-lactamase superfamily II)
MCLRRLAAFLCLSALLAAAWLGAAGSQANKENGWQQVAPGILRTVAFPHGYALVDGEAAMLIDAPHDIGDLQSSGARNIDGVVLTHYHRGVCAGLARLLQRGVKVRAAQGSEEWLSPEGVAKYWKESLPLRNSRTAYLVVSEGFKGIEYTLTDGLKFSWRGWNIEVLATPGHARVHVSFAVRKKTGAPLALFCGGALAAPGKLWAPYTTDWDHWTDAGLAPAAQSLRKLAGLKPDLLLPAYGPVIEERAAAALNHTAAAVEDVAFLKSFERFTKKRLGNPPSYRFLAKEQATSNGSKPWSQISEHIFLTGNTYVLTSRDNACLMIDPWDKRSADQIAKLQSDRRLGPLEVVMFSHAHYDHYDGIYHLAGRDKFEVWTLDQVAPPIADPFRWRAPFLDARPVKIDRRPAAGETLAWREYRFRFHYLPGQSQFTMGVETTIDGKRCYFTADNFFHQDMFSGSGGWMGLNRSFPLPYAESAQKVLDAAPDWVLAEHGGPFEFNAEDFRRRVAWGKVSAAAADALSPSGNHRHDWDPHRVHIEPLVHKVRPGGTIKATLAVANPSQTARTLTITLDGRGFFSNQKAKLDIPRGETSRQEVRLRLADTIRRGRHVFTACATEGRVCDPADAFLAVDVE